MESHEVLKETVNKVGAKMVAAELNLSQAMIYKWCESAAGADASGELNPLDRIVAICESATSDKPVKWLCEKRNGVFVRNTALEFDGDLPISHMKGTRRVVKEFSELLGALSDCYQQGEGVTPAAASRVRREWEDVKRAAERLVCACERGEFETSDAQELPASARTRCRRS